MAKKIEKESYEKISGAGGPRWSEDEEIIFMGLLCSYNYSERDFQNFEWDEAVSDLNRIFGNNRSVSAFKQRFTLEKIQEAYRNKLI